jgi:hypothetical protein
MTVRCARKRPPDASGSTAQVSRRPSRGPGAPRTRRQHRNPGMNDRSGAVREASRSSDGVFIRDRAGCAGSVGAGRGVHRSVADTSLFPKSADSTIGTRGSRPSRSAPLLTRRRNRRGRTLPPDLDRDLFHRISTRKSPLEAESAERATVHRPGN